MRNRMVATSPKAASLGVRLVIIVLAMGSSFASLCADTAIAWMGEMVPWPMMGTGIAIQRLALSENLAEEIELPASCGEEIRYMLRPLGDGPDPGITCAVAIGPQGVPLLRVDVRNSETLADDVWLSPARRLDLHAYAWLVEVGSSSRAAARLPGFPITS